MRAVVLANSPEAPHSNWLQSVEGDAFLVGVDGGTRFILEAGLVPDLVIGDLDSLSAETVLHLRKNSVVYSYPRDKNLTDLELALLYCVREKFESIEVYAWADERIDYMTSTLNFVSLLKAPIRLYGKRHHIEIITSGQGERPWSAKEVGRNLSIGSYSKRLSLNSSGLVWNLELKGVSGPYMSQSNRINDVGSLKVSEGSAFLIWDFDNMNEGGLKTAYEK